MRRLFDFFLKAYVFARVLAFFLHAGVGRGYPEPSWDWMFCYLSLAFPVAIFIHECGHYFTGLALGWRFQKFAIGPFQLARVNHRLRLELITARQYGLVGFIPSNFALFRIQYFLYCVAGPLASFAGGIVFVLLALRTHSAEYYWIYICNAQWAILGVMQLIPFASAGRGSDGYGALRSLRGGPSFDGLQAQTLSAASHANPLRPGDWPRALVLRMVDPKNAGHFKAPIRRYHAYLAYLHFLDSGEPELAGRYLDEVIAKWTPGDTPQFALEAAYYRAYHRGNPDGARNWLTLEKGDPEPWVRLRAQAAIECTSDPAQSLLLVDQALSALRTTPDCGARQYEMDRLQELCEGATASFR